VRGDRALLLALLLASLVLLPRAWLISRVHSECYDDEYHLVRGARFLLGTIGDMAQSDPPLGEALTALPLLLTNRNPAWTGTLYDHSLPPETTLLLVALWRSLLFLPVAGVAFAWCRDLYGPAAGWMAVALLLVEPTFAAHAPLASLDMLGAGGALIGSFLAWRAFERPTAGRILAAAFGAAAALLMKNTTVILPVVAAGYAVLFWVVRPLLSREPRAAWRAALPRRLAALGAAILVFLLSLWALTLFDVSPPDQPPAWQQETTALTPLLDRPLPAGIYVGSLLRARWHADQGHPAFLFGEKSGTGWWYYFPAVLSYKMPIGIAVVLALALLSLAWRPPRFEEWGPFLPMVLWTATMLLTRINIGVRHFLPAYVFILLLGTRSAAPAWPAGASSSSMRAPRLSRIAAWLALGAAALHVASWHPDYLAYLNLPRDRAWLDISDSNLDWGQGLKQARRWIDRHPQPPGRPIYLLYFGDPNSPRRVAHYLGGRVTLLGRQEPLPDRGLLIASPVWVAGPFDWNDRYAALRAATPIDIIGHSLLVYDLDVLRANAVEADTMKTDTAK
jgi:hypothetical protein